MNNQLQLLLILVLIGLINAATTTFNLPIKLNMTDMGCDYIERFNLMFEDSTTQVAGTYNTTGGYYQLSGFKNYQDDWNNKLRAEDFSKKPWTYTLKYIRLYRVRQNAIEVEQDAFNVNDNPEELELQIFFEQTQFDLSKFESFDDRRFAFISIFFTTGYQNISSYLPDGLDMLLPFIEINPTFAKQQNVELNLNRQFESIQDYFHQYMAFQTTLNNQSYTAYFNKKKFYIPQSIVDTFFASKVGLTATNPTVITQDQMDSDMIKICYGTVDETVLRQNYAVWLWIVGLIVWWIVMVCTENDTESVFLDDYRDNKLTMIPLYSMYKLNNDLFFSKLSRQSHYLLYFSWEILIISILYGQFYIDDTYEVQDAIILWYAIIAIVLAWPVGYFFGWIIYTARDLNKAKIQLEIDYKQITNKQSPEAEKIHAAILDEENRMYTAWYTYYGMMFLALWANILISVWQMKFVDEDTSAYWVATVFVMIFMDQIVLDSIVPFLPLAHYYQKYRGYWFDADLAKLWKHREEL